MNSMSNYFQWKRVIIFLMIGAFGVGMILIGWYGFLWYNYHKIVQKNEERKTLTMDVRQKILRGDYFEVVVAYDALRAKTENESIRHRLDLQKEISRFYSGGKDAREQAVRSISAIVSDTTLDVVLRASSVEALLAIYFSDQDPQTLNLILTQEPFASLSMSGNTDKYLAVRQIAEFGNALYPLAALWVAEGGWYAESLLDSSLEPGRVVEYRKKLSQAITSARSLELSEEKSIPELTRIGFLTSIGFLEGVLQVGVSEPVNVFEATFREALSLANMYPDSVSVQDSSLYTRLYYARILHRLYGEGRRSDIEVLLKDLAETYQSIGVSKQPLFRSFITNDALRSGGESNYLHQVFVDFSLLSPEFKSLLQQNGWNL